MTDLQKAVKGLSTEALTLVAPSATQEINIKTKIPISYLMMPILIMLLKWPQRPPFPIRGKSVYVDPDSLFKIEFTKNLVMQWLKELNL